MNPATANAVSAGTGHDIIVIGASAGGVEALKKVAAGLPPALPASLFVVLHRTDTGSMLASLLNRWGPLPAVDARDGMIIEHGMIYVAPPDRHMLLQMGTVRVPRGPKENRHRPSIDPLFRSAAWAYGPRVIGVLLSGTLSDGTAGLWAIRSCGGQVVVQDPTDAPYPGMPTSALETLDADYCVPAAQIGALVGRLAHLPAADRRDFPVPEQVKLESSMVQMQTDDEIREVDKLGKLTPSTCPACHGSLWEIDDEHVLRYRCHTGHAFTANALETEHDEALEAALFSALRALEESAAIARRVARAIANRTSRRRRSTKRRGARKATQSRFAIFSAASARRRAIDADPCRDPAGGQETHR